MSHPVENIMRSTMEQLRQMVDVNTIVGCHQVKQVQHPEKRKLRRGISNRGICEDGC